MFSGLLSAAPEPVTLQLKWKHQFQFAGYYAALDKGFYNDAGLDVTINELRDDLTPVQSVVQGESDFGVGNSSIILDHAQGSPVIVLGVVFQHSPLAIMSLASSGYSHIHELADKKLMLEGQSVELLTYFRREGVNPDSLNTVPHGLSVESLLSRDVDAMSVYITDEPYELENQATDYTLFHPSTSGIDFYGDNLFTSRKLLEKDPDLVRRFREASFKGWKYAMDNPEEIIQLIFTRYTKRHSIEHLRFEAEKMQSLLQPNLLPLGYMNPGRWQHITRTYQAFGVLPEGYDSSSLLYKENNTETAVLERWLLISLATLALVLSVVIYVVNLNRRLNSGRARLQTIVENAPVALVTLDMKGTVVTWNQQSETIFGWKSDEVVGKCVYDFMVPESDKDQVSETLKTMGTELSTINVENWNLCADGRKILCEWRNAYLENAAGKQQIISMAMDVTKQRELESRLKHQAHFDHLTGLPNRALFYDRFQQALSRAQRMETELALIFIDLDNFKEVNDSFGHEAGDKVLKTIATRLKDNVREMDTVARMGGDEFIILLPVINGPEDCTHICSKLEKFIEKPIPVQNHVLSMRASFGVSMYPDDGPNLDALLSKADKAMYVDKYADKEKSISYRR